MPNANVKTANKIAKIGWRLSVSIPPSRFMGGKVIKHIFIFVILLYSHPTLAWGDITHPDSLKNYIQPNSQIVKDMAGQLYIDEYGVIKYIVNDSIFYDVYTYDGYQFGIIDYWQPAEDYITGGMKGDCEDRAIALMSLMESGNMSVMTNGSLIKRNIAVRFYLGTAGSSTDAWVDYIIGGRIYHTTTNPQQILFMSDSESNGFFSPEIVYLDSVWKIL